MVELNEKAVEAAWYAGREARGMRLAPPDEAGLRGLREAIGAYLSALHAPDDGLVERLRESAEHLQEYVEEVGPWPSVYKHCATTLQSQAEQIERLVREKKDAFAGAILLGYASVSEADDRVKAAEQQVQKLTADKANLHKTGQEYLVASEAVFDWMNGNDLSADYEEQCPRDFARVCKAIVEFRSALETQDDQK